MKFKMNILVWQIYFVGNSCTFERQNTCIYLVHSKMMNANDQYTCINLKRVQDNTMNGKFQLRKSEHHCHFCCWAAEERVRGFVDICNWHISNFSYLIHKIIYIYKKYKYPQHYIFCKTEMHNILCVEMPKSMENNFCLHYLPL